MTRRRKRFTLPDKRWVRWAVLIIMVGMWSTAQFKDTPRALAVPHAIAGRVIDEQGEPVVETEVTLYINDDEEALAHAATQPDGTFLLVLPDDTSVESARVEFERHHFAHAEWVAEGDALESLQSGSGVVLEDTILLRVVGVAFWIATIAFLGMLTLIAFEWLDKTLAALLGLAILWAVTFIGGAISPSLYIFNFEQALEYIDFEVIFLLLGMMIVIGTIEATGIFQWLAYQAYRLSGGRVWLMAVILMIIAAVASALLDNVTTMLLMTPITIEIALAMGIGPLTLLIPALMASNVGGLATLVGTPVNIMVGSYADLSFTDFIINQTPGVILAMAGLIIYVLLRYRKQFREEQGSGVSPAMEERLIENSRIRQPKRLRKSMIVFAGLLLLFLFGEPLHLTPAVSAIIGAVLMLIWVNPDVESMMQVVDWTTLVFFLALFMVIGAVQEVGLISMIAVTIGNAVGGQPVLAMLVLLWVTSLLSGVIANIPFAAAMLPVVRFLTAATPGIDGNALYYTLALGADMGGNSSLIASSANLIVAGITERAGYPLTFMKFLSAGLPATIITTALGMLWLLIRFF